MAFTAQTLDAFKFHLMTGLADAAFISVRPHIPSSTLQAAMIKKVKINTRLLKSELFIPHFWAIMVHDGRGPMGPRKAKFLVYFADELDDPRKPTPARAVDVRPLTKGEFQQGLAENQRLLDANPNGGPFQHMIVVKDPKGLPGRVGAQVAQPFFITGAKSFESRVDNLVFTAFDTFVRANVFPIFDKLTAVVKIR